MPALNFFALTRGAASHFALILSITATTSARTKEAALQFLSTCQGPQKWMRIPIPLHILQNKLVVEGSLTMEAS